jgi:hypothetical protein
MGAAEERWRERALQAANRLMQKYPVDGEYEAICR